MERDADREKRTDVTVLFRLGSTPQQRGSTDELTCPDFFALSDGNIACIGTDMTEALRDQLPPDAGIGPDERLVSVPRQTVHDALPDIIKILNAA